MGNLTSKVAIVTGGSRGIGAAIAKRLGKEGAKIIVNYTTHLDAANDVVDSIRSEGGEAISVKADIANRAEIWQLFLSCREHFHQLDILINNAGISEMRSLEDLDEEHFDLQFAVNVRGLTFASQEAVKLMAGSGGNIVNITSGAAQSPPARMSVYSATKAAVEALTKSHAAELGPIGIRVNAVAPGLTDTDMLRNAIPPEYQKALIGNTALRRLGKPEDIADVVAFLVSEEARWITGQVLGVSGGLR